MAQSIINFPRVRKQRRSEKFRHFPSTEQLFLFLKKTLLGK